MSREGHIAESSDGCNGKVSVVRRTMRPRQSKYDTVSGGTYGGVARARSVTRGYLPVPVELLSSLSRSAENGDIEWSQGL